MLNSIQINTETIDALGLNKEQREHLLNHIEEVLIALRRVIRATDLHSKYLAKTTGLTAPQILLLQTLRDKGQVTIGELAQEMSLSQATVTTILDRLEKRGLVYRQRSQSDKRKVHAYLTEAATETLKSAPIPLQDRFTREFSKLDEWEQAMIMSALKRVAQMMDAQHIDASPVLDIGMLDRYEDEQDIVKMPTKKR
ncbi:MULTISPECIES: MarR family winged helix-turn-helix transcriptional regulator [unclassified Methylophaga]|uniref:MarR family winged helix-turn-helix transcriptional regulator n=1 Tax=unclassified Methylophaga TaxID=2629249 RepID=UPI0010A93C33|nr:MULTISPECIES: MarR family transcriptional regulator [unclassified Methylophaga]MDO8827510.1 MarR family transcriptional regulator [Methylophaga sp.]THK40328.1 MarR family transcriptional regulator [Methylophaga sp. SB9B]